MPRVKTSKKAKKVKKSKRKKKVKKIEKIKPLEVAEKPVEKPAEVPSKYYETVGRRKTAVARVRLSTRPARGYPEKMFLVNQKPIEKYFPTAELQNTAKAALETMKSLDKFGILTTVKGGGLSSQAEAIRHGIARALTLFNPDFRKRLKRAGFLKRDSRMRERKKFGLKRARRAPQWQKR